MSSLFTSVANTIVTVDSGSLYAQKRISQIKVLDVFAAKRVDNGLESLLVLKPQGCSDGIDEWPQSDGFQVIQRDIGGKSLLCLELSGNQYCDVFHALAEDICGVLEEETTVESAIRSMQQRLFRWQAFLRRNSPTGLSQNAQTGLFGELHILRHLFMAHLDPAIAVLGWRGCKRANQDFQYAGLAMEVKTTTAVIPDRIHISNAQQLDAEGISNLFLAVVWAHKNETAGTTLPEVVSEIHDGLTESTSSLFNDGLVEAGYLDTQTHLYKAGRYQPKDLFYYRVSDEFPRLTKAQIPDSIKAVKYQISLDACTPFILDSDAVSTIITNIKETDSRD